MFVTLEEAVTTGSSFGSILIILLLIVSFIFLFKKIQNSKAVRYKNKNKKQDLNRENKEMLFCPKCGFCYSDLDSCPQCGEMAVAKKQSESTDEKITVICSNCNSNVSIEKNYSWKSMECPHCHKYFDISK